ncbi:MAG: helix-turn-helix transcriptional regulator [Oscillospiraceae bacterium]|nr:helix-turn-helix transcriptional regulator [Oscillospiraceae bacterium]
MNINIGENIKILRKGKNLTQEDLAEYLGISFQSVSKWERGEGFPDITMLPDLADFFNISVDDLIGAGRVSGGDLYDLYKRAREYEIAGEVGKAIDLLRETLKKSPNQYDVMAKLAILLITAGKRDEGVDIAKKAIILCERRLDGIIGEKQRSYAKSILCFLYDFTGDFQKGRELARNLPHVWESREILYAEMVDWDEYAAYLRDSLRIILNIFAQKIEGVKDMSKRLSVVDLLVLGGKNDDLSIDRINKIVDFLQSEKYQSSQPCVN